MIKRTSIQYRTALIFLLCTGFLGVCLPAEPAERGQELSGEHDQIVPGLSAPGSVEPERERAGANQNRPTLKLPEVVVKGDKQYRVTAERRDLLLMDPMWGTKEMPADIGKVDVPGLEKEKNAPSSDTITAKNYLFLLEGAGGTERSGLGRLIAGCEFSAVDLILRANYKALDHPLAYGIRPMDQRADGDLELGIHALPGVNLSVGLLGKGETNRQPETNASWGDWLERTLTDVRLRSEITISPYSKISVMGQLGRFNQVGVRKDPPQMKSTDIMLLGEFEQNIQGLTPEDLNLLVKFKMTRQEVDLQSPAMTFKDREYLQSILARLRCRPVSVLHVDVGVAVDEFAGVKNMDVSSVIGQASLVLPVGAVLYGKIDAGIQWDLVSEWSYDRPRQTVNSLPLPETKAGHYQAGWRQKYGDQLSSDVSWFRYESKDIPVWVDGNRDGLFTLINLSEGKREGVELEVEIRYDRHISQQIQYVYQEAVAGSVLHLPDLAQHEGNTKIRFDFEPVSASLSYRYLGARFGDPADPEPKLAAAHLLGMDCDVKVSSYFNVFLMIENVLGYTWDEYQGYPGRTLNFMAGARVSF